MEQLKFRAWDGSKMITPEKPHEGSGSGSFEYAILMYGTPVLFSVFGFEPSKTIDAKPMQSICLQDKNEKDIFVGDVFDIGQTVNGRSRFYVHACLPKLDIRYAYDSECKYEYDAYDLMTSEDLEVIGNIYENHSLINHS